MSMCRTDTNPAMLINARNMPVCCSSGSNPTHEFTYIFMYECVLIEVKYSWFLWHLEQFVSGRTVYIHIHITSVYMYTLNTGIMHSTYQCSYHKYKTDLLMFYAQIKFPEGDLTIVSGCTWLKLSEKYPSDSIWNVESFSRHIVYIGTWCQKLPFVFSEATF